MTQAIDTSVFSDTLFLNPSAEVRAGAYNETLAATVRTVAGIALVVFALGIIGSTAYYAPYYVPVAVVALGNPKTLELTNKMISQPLKNMHESAAKTHKLAKERFKHFTTTVPEDVPAFLQDHGLDIEQTASFAELVKQVGSRECAFQAILPLVATFKTWKHRELAAWEKYYGLLDKANALAETEEATPENLSSIAKLRLEAYKVQTEEVLPAKISTVYYFALLSNVQNKSAIQDLGTFTAMEFHYREALTNDANALSMMKKVSTVADRFFTTQSGNELTRKEICDASYVQLAQALFS